jgi:hypothetical protein
MESSETVAYLSGDCAQEQSIRILSHHYEIRIFSLDLTQRARCLQVFSVYPQLQVPAAQYINFIFLMT